MAEARVDCDLTILTTTHNRAHLLPRLYESIVASLSSLPDRARIEWVIVDDGSTDGTAACIANFAARAPFPVYCVSLDHGGKHRALNAGFAVVQGKWVMIVDSDDWLLDDGIETTLAEIEKAQEERAGALFLCVTVLHRDRQYGFIRPERTVSYIERLNTEPPFDSTPILSIDLCRLRFREIPGEIFLAEGDFFPGLSLDHGIYLSNAIAVAVEYQPNGLSANSLALRTGNPVGTARLYQRMSEQELRAGLQSRTLANFGRFWWHCVFRRTQVIRPRGVLQTISIVPGLVLALADVRKMRRDTRLRSCSILRDQRAS